MAYWDSNGHVADRPMSLLWPRKVKLVTPIRLASNISKTAVDAI